jgi:NAD(P)-dependent dehydrogenase (short-subunit alcohol dehydrogenase family)
MVERLTDKVAIITGGSTGIGKGIAELFIKEGASTVLCSRSLKDIKKTVNEISSDNTKIMGLECDVSKSDEVKDLINRTVDRFGKIDILVNNAGKNPARQFTVEDLTEEEWEEYFAINVKGTWLTSKYSLPELKKAGGGSIIMISSISAHIGQNLVGCYNSSKAAQEGLVRSMAMDYGKYNIRVNAICPAWVMTDRTKQAREKMIKEIKKMHIIERIGTPKDIAWAAVYLASDESTWVTGASFAIDGGYMAK